MNPVQAQHWLNPFAIEFAPFSQFSEYSQILSMGCFRGGIGRVKSLALGASKPCSLMNFL